MNGGKKHDFLTESPFSPLSPYRRKMMNNNNNNNNNSSFVVLFFSSPTDTLQTLKLYAREEGVPSDSGLRWPIFGRPESTVLVPFENLQFYTSYHIVSQATHDYHGYTGQSYVKCNRKLDIYCIIQTGGQPSTLTLLDRWMDDSNVRKLWKDNVVVDGSYSVVHRLYYWLQTWK